MRLRFALLAFLLTLLYGCDSSTPAQRVDDGTLLSNAREWFDAEANSAQSGASANSLHGTDDDALYTFYPDWENGVTIETPDGGAAVVTTLWRDANVTHDAYLFFLRTLAVELSPDGEVERGRIVEFISPDSIAYTDGPSLVGAWLAEDFEERRVLAVERNVDYELEQARLFMPGQTPVEKEIRVERVERPEDVQNQLQTGNGTLVSPVNSDASQVTEATSSGSSKNKVEQYNCTLVDTK